jgi:tRNA nucleotidyltransferase (CCA-adding enzyme)
MSQQPFPARWQHFEHGADIGVRGIGPSQAVAFEQAALALTAVVTDPAEVEALEAVPITCTAPDEELLLLDWLNAIVSEMAVRGMLFGRYEVALTSVPDPDSPSGALRLRATAWGERLDPARHQPAVEVKGATCTELRVARAPGGWLAQTVVDV